MTNGPERVMVIVAHPDDPEFTCGGTVAKWVAEGTEVTYVVCTNGDKGSSDPAMTSEKLAVIREKEQQAAANVLGVARVVFLGYPDGATEDTYEFRGKLVRLIRQYRPDLVVTHDNYRRSILHRDHRVVGTVALDAVFPFSRDLLHYPEHIAGGLQSHKVYEVYLAGSDSPDLWIDTSETIDLKIAALRCHVTQVGSFEALADRIKKMAASIGSPQNIPYAEAFRRLELRR
ncbi:MAG: PIG-L deacetylase family protein [Dehalococcoidia bacterium]|nr:PIG-L deacetylase family protein [Dehalococcoidia bacterium]